MTITIYLCYFIVGIRIFFFFFFFFFFTSGYIKKIHVDPSFYQFNSLKCYSTVKKYHTFLAVIWCEHIFKLK